ncbi:MAG: PaaI family thioesterase [Acidobacteria bacterium]|nr:MAG: PaaI family thioesterase [Acidobacteriota bacterium]
MIRGMEKDQVEERRQKIIELTHSAPIIASLGSRLSYNETGEAVWDMPYHPGFDHALEGVHGGVFATLLDNAGWFTVAPHYDTWIATVEFQVRLLEHVQKRDLQAVGHLIKLGKRLATTRMEVLTADDGKIVAMGSGTFAPTSVKIPF